MEQKEIIKQYKKDELTIVWKPNICIHSAVCVHKLPNVYNPKEKPWIKAENASIEELKDQIDSCPSNALSYYMANENQDSIVMQTKVEVMQNGPLLISGSLEIKNEKGDIEMKERMTAFCRCGASLNKPYCDGQHKKVEFVG